MSEELYKASIQLSFEALIEDPEEDEPETMSVHGALTQFWVYADNEEQARIEAAEVGIRAYPRLNYVEVWVGPGYAHKYVVGDGGYPEHAEKTCDRCTGRHALDDRS